MTSGRPRSRQCFLDEDFGAVASLNHFLSRRNLARATSRRGFTASRPLCGNQFTGAKNAAWLFQGSLLAREAESFAPNLGLLWFRNRAVQCAKCYRNWVNAITPSAFTGYLTL